MTSKLYEPAIKASRRATKRIMDLTLNLDEDIEELERAAKEETLPGSCKSKYALSFKMTLDEKEKNFAMLHPKQGPIKINQKGVGIVEYQTVAGHWLKDREWAKKVNPKLFNEMERLE